MTAPTPDYATPESAPRLEPPPPPVLAPPTTATPPPPEMPSAQASPQLPPLGDLMVMLGGLMILGFSFGPFVSYATASRTFQAGSVNRSAWEWSAFMAPLTWFVILGGLFLLALGLSHALSGERKLFTFKISQLQLVVAAYTTSILIGYALADKSLSVNVNLLDAQLVVGNGEYAWGGVLMLVGSLVALVGAVFTLLRQPAFGYFGPTHRG